MWNFIFDLFHRKAQEKKNVQSTVTHYKNKFLNDAWSAVEVLSLSAFTVALSIFYPVEFEVNISYIFLLTSIVAKIAQPYTPGIKPDYQCTEVNHSGVIWPENIEGVRVKTFR